MRPAAEHDEAERLRAHQLRSQRREDTRTQSISCRIKSAPLSDSHGGARSPWLAGPEDRRAATTTTTSDDRHGYQFASSLVIFTLALSLDKSNLLVVRNCARLCESLSRCCPLAFGRAFACVAKVCVREARESKCVCVSA